jgi:Tol biopolymer transport system component
MGEDAAGNLWIGGRSGLVRLDRKGFISYGTADGFQSDSVHTINEAADGTLYFASVRGNGRKDNDLYRSRLVNGEYQKPENLGNVINTNVTEADPFIAPDQSYLIFSSDREGGAGEGDLYISFNQNGKWTAPQPLGSNINTAEYEYTPLVSADGKTFYFSRGWGEIFETDVSVLNLARAKAVK